MGSFEKLVVLTVIFLASIIVAVSFQSDDEPLGGTSTLDSTALGSTALGSTANEIGRSGDPLVADRGLEPAKSPVAAETPKGTGANSNRPNPFATGGANPQDGAGLLSATGTTQGAAADTAGANSGTARAETDLSTALPVVLSTATGLTPAYAGNGMYYYTVVPQDRTWAGLSEKFYGSSSWAGLLQRENAAVDQPQPGSLIIVPSRTEGADLARTQPYVARAPGRPAPPSPKVVPGLEQVPAAELTGQTYRTHVVGAGETLGGIAFHYYQRASLWKRIYDANRDVLVDPDRLVQGTTLKIP